MSQPLGQHFLKNQTAITRIIEALAIAHGEVIIEIGPGTGALTRPLLATCLAKGATLIAIEKDPALATSLDLGEGATVVGGDVLHELPKIVEELVKTKKSYKVVGNIPYYITGAILRTISELPAKPKTTVLMVQREVAVRVCAAPGAMNLLSAATQIWAEPKLLFTLPPKDFDPPPAVWSAVVLLRTKKEQLSGEVLEKYYKTLKIVFKQPRKTLLNNLSEGGIARGDAAALLAKLPLDLTEKARAQDLTPEAIATLSASLPETPSEMV